MTLEKKLGAVRRDASVSITQQLVEVFAEAIEAGELEPGAKLPPTRALAEMAGINQLTASRCYRRLAERGLVVAGVGRGTFVRTSAVAVRQAPPTGGGSWQTYVLPPERDGYGSRMIADLVDHVARADLIPMSAGYLSEAVLPVEEVRDYAGAVLRDAAAEALQYSPVEGVTALREELAELGRRRGLTDPADGIVVTTGARQGLTLAARAILRPGHQVACESPTFMGIIETLRGTGAEVFGIPVDEGGLDVDALEQLLRRHEIRLLVLQPRLHNPTGYDLAEPRRARLVELAAQHGFFILEDAVYGDLHFQDSHPPPLRAADADHVVYVDSLSKTISPGLRIGWVAASGPVLDRIVSEKRNDDAHSPSLTQMIAARLLGAGDYERRLPATREFHRVRRDALLAAIDEHMEDLATVLRPPGGGHVWMTLRQALDEQQLYREALEAGVSFIPGAAMLIERPRATHLRLSFSMLDPEQLAEGVRRLAGVVRSLQAARGRRRSMPVM
jgi:DNA-binding transcriptional MocR family regulator